LALPHLFFLLFVFSLRHMFRDNGQENNLSGTLVDEGYSAMVRDQLGQSNQGLPLVARCAAHPRRMLDEICLAHPEVFKV
jgi:hypothetical protein